MERRDFLAATGPSRDVGTVDGAALHEIAAPIAHDTILHLVARA